MYTYRRTALVPETPLSEVGAFQPQRVQLTELINPRASGEELCCEGGGSRLVGVRLVGVQWALQEI